MINYSITMSHVLDVESGIALCNTSQLLYTQRKLSPVNIHVIGFF